MTEPRKRNCMPDDHELTRMERLGIVRDWLESNEAQRLLADALLSHGNSVGLVVGHLRNHLTEQRQREAARGTQPRGAEWWTAPSTYFDPDESP